LSALAFTFGFNMQTRFANFAGVGLLAVIVLANVFAIVNIIRTQTWIRTHEFRAKGILETCFERLDTYDGTIHHDYRWPISRWKIRMALHVLLLFVAVVIVVLLAIL
jgi:hypothetical protein